MEAQPPDHPDAKQAVRTTDQPKARFFTDQALKIRMLAGELSAACPRDGIPAQLIHLADQLERRATEANDDRPYRVLVEFARVFARNEAEALDKCMNLVPIHPRSTVIGEPE